MMLQMQILPYLNRQQECRSNVVHMCSCDLVSCMESHVSLSAHAAGIHTLGLRLTTVGRV